MGTNSSNFDNEMTNRLENESEGINFGFFESRNVFLLFSFYLFSFHSNLIDDVSLKYIIYIIMSHICTYVCIYNIYI